MLLRHGHWFVGVVSEWLGQTLYERRNTVANQDRYNGFERWRRRLLEFEGNGIHERMAGQRKFLDFAPTQHASELWNGLES